MGQMKIFEMCTESRQGSRDLNEDSFLLLQDGLPGNVLALLAVADGIGGLGSGHVASSTALTTMAEMFGKLAGQYADREDPPVMDWLTFCFQKANAAVLRMGLTMRELRGMGTTGTAAAITRGKLHVCHVGDSRAYILRDGKLRQVTEDDWFRGLRGATGDKTDAAPRAANRTRPSGNESMGLSGLPAEMTLVTQAIGWQPLINPAKIVEDLHRGDILLLCTDGLTDNMPAAEIERLINEGGNLREICRRLADQAVETPGSDNVTVALARIGE